MRHDRRFPDHPRPFVKRIEFTGRINTLEGSAEPFDILVEYSLLGNERARGYVIGNNEDADRLGRLKLGADTVTVESWSPRAEAPRVRCDPLHFRYGPRRVRGQLYSETGPSSAIAEFEPHGLTVVTPLSSRPEDDNERQVTFYLVGPTLFWWVWGTGERSFDGNVKSEWNETELSLPLDHDIRAEVRPVTLYDQTPPPDKFDISTKRYAVTFKTKTSPTVLTHEALIESCTQAVDDLLLLMSFVSRGWIRWYRYDAYLGLELKEHVRGVSLTSLESGGHEETPVRPEKTRAFLSGALAALRRRRREGFNLAVPITYLVAGQGRRTLEDQFVTLFLALEKLRALYATARRLERLVDTAAFGALRKELEATLRGAGLDRLAAEGVDSAAAPELIERMAQRLGDLNRPSLFAVLSQFFLEFGVEWRDLYPPSAVTNRPLFFEFRNRLQHGAVKVPPERFVFEIVRVRCVLERMILSLLDWRDHDWADPGVYRNLLLERVGGEGEAGKEWSV